MSVFPPDSDGRASIAAFGSNSHNSVDMIHSRNYPSQLLMTAGRRLSWYLRFLLMPGGCAGGYQYVAVWPAEQMWPFVAICSCNQLLYLHFVCMAAGEMSKQLRHRYTTVEAAISQHWIYIQLSTHNLLVQPSMMSAAWKTTVGQVDHTITPSRSWIKVVTTLPVVRELTRDKFCNYI